MSSSSAEAQAMIRMRKKDAARAQCTPKILERRLKRRERKARVRLCKSNSELVANINAWLSRLLVMPTPLLSNELDLPAVIGGIAKAFVSSKRKAKARQGRSGSNESNESKESNQLNEDELVSIYFSATPIVHLLGINREHWNDYLTWIGERGTRLASESEDVVRSQKIF
jgi:hypothetical protein